MVVTRPPSLRCTPLPEAGDRGYLLFLNHIFFHSHQAWNRHGAQGAAEVCAAGARGFPHWAGSTERPGGGPAAKGPGGPASSRTPGPVRLRCSSAFPSRALSTPTRAAGKPGEQCQVRGRCAPSCSGPGHVARSHGFLSWGLTTARYARPGVSWHRGSRSSTTRGRRSLHEGGWGQGARALQLFGHAGQGGFLARYWEQDAVAQGVGWWQLLCSRRGAGVGVGFWLGPDPAPDPRSAQAQVPAQRSQTETPLSPQDRLRRGSG